MTFTRTARIALAFFLLASTVLAQTTIFEFEGPPPSPIQPQFGRALCSAGDVNGDGFDDVLIGAPDDSASSLYSGSVRVISGRHGSLIRVFHGEENEHLGRALCGLGDVDGDGRADYAVGLAKPDSPGEGSVRVFSGGTGLVIWEVTGPPALDFGYSLEAAGDVDGDGVTDLLAPGTGHYVPHGQPNRSGDVWVYSGSTGALLHQITGFDIAPPYAMMETVSQAAGDLDADGVPDVMVTSYGRTGDSLVRVFSGASWALLYTYPGMANVVSYYIRSSAGDWNGDGHDDFTILASFSYPNAPPPEIQVISGATGSVLQTLKLSTRLEWILGVVNVGDTNGDGLDDLAVMRGSWPLPGFSWTVRVYAGGTGVLLTDPDRELGGTSDWFPELAAAGDVNGDGVGDVIVGSTGNPDKVFVFSPTTLEIGVAYHSHGCPCNNDPPITDGTGCTNSTGVGGRLRGYGIHLHLNDDLELHLSQAPPSSPVILLRSIYSGSNTSFPSDGVLALHSPERIGVAFTDSAGEVQFHHSKDWAYGAVDNFQCWYRDSNSGPCGTGNNYSNMLQVSAR